MVLVEDIVTTGGQVIEAIKNITDAGGKVMKVIVALDRLEGGRENISWPQHREWRTRRF